MDVIRKKISLEPFIGRTNMMLPSYADNQLVTAENREYNISDGNWGLIPSDIVISIGNDINGFRFVDGNKSYKYENIYKLKDKLRFEENDKGQSVLRYSVMITAYYFFLEFIRTTRYYRNIDITRSNTGSGEMSENMWELEFGISPTYKDEDGVIREDPDYAINKYKKALEEGWPFITNERNIGNNIYACVNPDYEKFKSYFILDDDEFEQFHDFITDPSNNVRIKSGTSYLPASSYTPYFDYGRNVSVIFYEFVNYFKDNEVGDNDLFAPQFLPIMLYLDSPISLIGNFEADYAPWMPNRRYYIGDRVSYSIDGELNSLSVYKLIYDRNMRSSYGYDDIEITKEIYDGLIPYNPQNGSTTFMKEEDGIVHYYLRKLYYKGYYDEGRKITFFDNIDSNTGELVLNHWMECTISEDIEFPITINVDGTSYLGDMLRMKRTFDDNSEEMPFVFSDVVVGGNTYSDVPEIRYTLGNLNVGVDNDVLHCDILRRIAFYKEGGTFDNPFIDFRYEVAEGAGETDYPSYITIKDGEETISDYPQSISARSVGLRKGYVLFEYIKDAHIDEYGRPYEENGITRTEVYKFENSSNTFSIYSQNNPASYIWIEVVSEGMQPEDADERVNTYTDLPSAFECYGELYYVEDAEKFYMPQMMVTYISFDFERSYWYDDDGKFVQDGTPTTRINYNIDTTPGGKNEVDTISVPIFSNGTANSISNMKLDVSATIDRGKSAAWERHNILGEIHTMKDLINYRNNLFKL